MKSAIGLLVLTNSISFVSVGLQRLAGYSKQQAAVANALSCPTLVLYEPGVDLPHKNLLPQDIIKHLSTMASTMPTDAL